jgi:2'-5' RNA ligase
MFESALIVEVPEAEPAVGRWRSMLDPVSGVGIPAHVTVLYPFLERVSDKALQGIKEIAASVQAFSFTLASVARWPGVVYLPPTPTEPFLDLTKRCLERWPHLRPYGGEFDDVVPHLTVAQKKDGPFDDQLAATITEDLETHLPISSRATMVSVWVTDGGAWTAHTTFPLGEAAH